MTTTMSQQFQNTTPLSNSSESEASGQPTLVICHIYLMLISWMILVPTAISSAFNMRLILKNKINYLKIIKSKTEFWYDIHFYCNSTSGLLTIISLLCIFLDAKEWAGNWDWMNNHCYYGMMVFLLLCINIVLGFARPSGNDARRKNFNYIHGTVGVLCLIFSWMTIEQGLDFWYFDDEIVEKKFGLTGDQVRNNTFLVFWLFVGIMVGGFVLMQVLRSSFCTRKIFRGSSKISNKIIEILFYVMTLFSFGCGLVLMVYLSN